jgi:succinate dehydrogenase/fumarate reductase flavoprotein subunit
MGQISGQTIAFHHYDTVIVGSGAAGLNCAVHLYEFMSYKGVKNPQERIVIVTAGLGLGASRMSGSDKQTYYKISTSPDVPDSAEEFARTLTAAGCCHGDLALAEAVGSLREFYHLVQVGVPFPTDSMGSFIGYKTDNDPGEAGPDPSRLRLSAHAEGLRRAFERATSAGPKTSKFMTECLQRQLERYGVEIYDNQEVCHLLTVGSAPLLAYARKQGGKRIAGVVTIDKKVLNESNYAINVFLGANIVFAAGGPGELYKASVYPKGQVGIHGLAFKAGLIGENLTESQFGLASIKFRWNVSGTYMQAIPRIFSTDATGKDEREFLADFFPSMGKMATNIFLKGYQWPFDPQRIDPAKPGLIPPAFGGGQSSLIDILVFNETKRGRRVFLDFRCNPIPDSSKSPAKPGLPLNEGFNLNDLEPEANKYLKRAGALRNTPLERLFAMNPLAIEIYKENGIDLYSEPLEIALCAQHNNGGFAVDKWWQSNIPRTFIIGEMAATHGVRRPGGAALNAGQVGGLRTAEYIVNFYGYSSEGKPDYSDKEAEITQQLSQFVSRLESYKRSAGLVPEEVIEEIQSRMTTSAGHIRELGDGGKALQETVGLYKDIQKNGFKLQGSNGIIRAIQAEHLSLTSVAYLKAIVELLKLGSGSRGSHLVLSEDGVQIPDIINKATGKVLKFKPENKELRDSVLQIEYDEATPDLFRCRTIQVRPMPADRKAFELAWQDYREGKI